MKILSLLFGILLLAVNQLEAISLRWTLNDNTEGVISYKIYTVQTGLVTSVAGNVNHVSIDAYLQGDRTVLYITAVNGSGESLPSAKITVQKH